jgi:hypothetical protein
MRNSHLLKSVTEFCVADRQWPRALRIKYARFQLGLATEDGRTDKVRFWTEVLKRNGAR